MKLRRTTILMLWFMACLAGLALGRKWPHFSGWLVVVSIVVWLSCLKYNTRLLLLACLAFGLSLGWWRGAAFRQQTLHYEELYGQQVVLQVTARSDGIYAKETGNLSFDGENVAVILPVVRSPPGIVKVEIRGVPAVFRGDRLEISGKLYPAGGSRQGSMKYAQAALLSRHVSRLDRLRLQFIAASQSVLPEPHASFALGILVGLRTTLPEDVSDQLSSVGLTHIIAVSGYNLTIIVRYAGKRFGRSKFQTLTLSLLLIGIFLLLTDFGASIVRAAVVSLFSLGAWYYGRSIRPLLVLLLSGAVTAMWNPIYVWSDIGWYLSFLAFFGVLIIGPLVTAYFWKGREPNGLMSLVVESASAQLMAAPLIMHIFEETSVVALPANMIVVPLIPLVMLLSVLGGLAGMMSASLGAWIAWPAKVLISFILEIVTLLARVPYAVWQQGLSLTYMLLIYGLICAVCWWLWTKTRSK